jgi:KaiC/GvpD/RAD55 family RecA-like ATPase
MIIDIKKEVAEGQYQEYHIAMKTLMKYEVECTSDSKDEIIIRYSFGNGNYKECRPRSEAKWKTIKRSSSSHPPFGYVQLPETGKIVVFTGGEKDVLAFDMLGIPAISMQNERANIPANLVEELRKRFQEVMICYDTDKTGVECSKKWEKLYGLPRIVLPDDLKGNDIYDFVSNGRTRIELMELLKTALMNQKTNKENQKMDKTYFTGKEVLELKNTKEYIIEGILPKSTLAGLIGGSDTGKSLFLLQFAISYILNKQFLGFDINGGKKVLFFSFEDDPHSLNSRLGKLINNISLEERKKVCENIFFECDPDGMEQKIDSHMENHPDTGVIIIDPLAEVLHGADINSPSSVRESMQFLKKASFQYNATVLFIHHITKSSEEKGKLNKSNSIGSQGIEAKSRLVIEMKKNSNPLSSFIALGIVKGNDVDERYKSSVRTLNLQLNTYSLWFEKVEIEGHIPTSKLEIDWDVIYGENKKMRAKEIIQRLEDEYQLDNKQAQKVIEIHLRSFRLDRGIYGKPEINKKTASERAA